MNEKIKNYFGIAAAFALVVLALASISYVMTYSRSIEPSSFRSFSATAEGKVVAVPDIAQFSYSVITEGGLDIGKAQADNVNKANAIMDFLKGNGVDAKDIKTTGWNIDPRYENYYCKPVYSPDSSGTPVPCPPPKIVGYTVRHSVSVKVRDMAKSGDILSGVVSKGANDVSNLQFTVDEPDTYKTQAREEAIAKAKEKAKAIAKAGGFSVGRLLSIEEGDISPYYGYGMGGDMAKSVSAYAEAAPAPSIEPGSQDITVTVVLRYEIK